MERDVEVRCRSCHHRFKVPALKVLVECPNCGEIEFRDASHLKNYTLPQTLDVIRTELGDQVFFFTPLGGG